MGVSRGKSRLHSRMELFLKNCASHPPYVILGQTRWCSVIKSMNPGEQLVGTIEHDEEEKKENQLKGGPGIHIRQPCVNFDQKRFYKSKIRFQTRMERKQKKTSQRLFPHKK